LPTTVPTRADLVTTETIDESAPADTLKLLTAEIGDTTIESDPFALTPVPLPKTLKRSGTRHRKPRMDQAPETTPMFNSSTPPQVSPLFMTQRVEPGLQIPLF